MNIFTLTALIYLGFALFRDYKKDKGLNKKAKIFQTICLYIICLLYSGSFRHIGGLIRHFDIARDKFGVDVGLVSGQMHFFIYLLNLFFVLIVLILAYQLIGRKEKARSQIIWFLPLLCLTEIFSFYRGWLSEENGLQISDGFIFLIGFIIMGGITAFVIIIYTRDFMKTFFLQEPVIITSENEPEIASENDNITKDSEKNL